MLQFSLVFMLQERGPRQKTCLMTDIITFGVGNSAILNQDGKMKILRHVACFYSKCLAKMKNERPAWQCFLTILHQQIIKDGAMMMQWWRSISFLCHVTVLDFLRMASDFIPRLLRKQIDNCLLFIDHRNGSIKCSNLSRAETTHLMMVKSVVSTM